MVEISIILITYNHEDYITQAIDSILNQDIQKKRCELIIAEDFSSDQTRLLIDNYDFSSFSKCIKLYRKRNIGLVENLAEAISLAQGKYIAMISGDDYWNNPKKLSHQKEILDTNEDCQIVYTAVEILKNGTLSRTNQSHIKTKSTIADVENLFNFPFSINASTVMVRNLQMSEYIKLLLEARFEDIALYFFSLNLGAAYFIKTVCSVYRVHKKSMWRSYNENVQLLLKIENLLLINKMLYEDKLFNKIAENLSSVRMVNTSKAPTTRRLSKKIIKIINFLFSKLINQT